MLEKTHFKDLIIYVLVIILFILAAWILKPIIFSIIYGILLAYIFHPIYRFILSKIKSELFSALVVCVGVLIVIITAAVLFIGAIFRQAINLYLFLQKLDITSLVNKILPKLVASSGLSESIVNSLSTSISTLIANYLRQFTELISNFPQIIIQLIVVIITFFFVLKDGKRALEYIKSLSPIKKETEEKFFKHLKDITSSVLIGHIIVGLIQGLFAGLGYFVFGIPNALLLTFITMITSMIPIFGAWIVWLPVAIYLFVSGNTAAGIGLLIYGFFFVSWIDNLLRMLIVAKRTKLNIGIVMIGMLGGLFTFGFLGLIIGPLILSYVLLVIDLYRKNNMGEDLVFKKEKNK